MDPRRLREATRAEHEATEALMPLSGPDLTREMYTAVLQALEPLVRGWEQWAEAAAPETMRDLLMRRRRSHLLARDLETLGAGLEGRGTVASDWSSVVPARSDGAEGHQAFEAAFLGAVYVMEGSTLGGRFIARHVEEILGLKPGFGDAYFQGHGDATAAMWREVTARIAEVPEELAPWVIEGARRTFRVFGDALRDRALASHTGQH